MRPDLLAGPELALRVTHPKHMTLESADLLADGVGSTTRQTSARQADGDFASTLLAALDGVSANAMRANALEQAAITDPDSVDAHDITIAQAKAQMSLNITKTVLSRVVQGWKDLINAR
jgi:flagellar hook-basal body complex protein FliE